MPFVVWRVQELYSRRPHAILARPLRLLSDVLMASRSTPHHLPKSTSTAPRKGASRRGFAGRAVRWVKKRLGVGSDEVDPDDWERALVEAEAQGDPVKLRIAAYQAAASLLGDLIDQVPPEERPDYPPDLRQRILKVREELGWSDEQTARMFRVSSSTIAEWRRQLNPTGKTDS